MDGWPTALTGAEPDVVVLAGYMRIVGPRTLAAFGGRMLNVHPSLLPAFPGANAVRDALSAGVKTTGVTVHLVDEHLDGGPIVLQEPVAIAPTDDEARLLERSTRSSTGCWRRPFCWLVAADAADAMLPPKRALLSVSDKSGLAEFAQRPDCSGLRAGVDRRHGRSAACGRTRRDRRRPL